MRAVLLLLLAACNSISWEQVTGRLHYGAEKLRYGVARALTKQCCLDSGEACDSLANVLTTDRLVSPSLIYLQVKEQCRARVGEVFVSACMGACSPYEIKWVLFILSEADPSTRVAHVLIQQLRRTFDVSQPGAIADRSERDQYLETPQEDIRGSVTYAIARLGEDELALFVPLLTKQEAAPLRISVFAAFVEALDLAPLEMPELLAAAKAAGYDSDERIRSAAETVVRKYESRSQFVFDKTLDESTVIRMLAVRRFFCHRVTVVAALESLAKTLPERAGQAMEFRRRRCASLR